MTAAQHLAHPGTPIRLWFDEGPATIGYVLSQVDDARLRVEFPVVDDGTVARPDAEPEGEFIQGPAFTQTLPATLLVAVCEHVETYDDEWGLACSEPNVPTVMSIPCLMDATFSVADPISAVPTNLCAEHVDALDVLTDNAEALA